MGEIHLRLPDRLHEQLRTAAVAARRSVNAQAIWYIEQALEQENRND